MCNAWHILYGTVYILVTILIETYLISTNFQQSLLYKPSTQP